MEFNKEEAIRAMQLAEKKMQSNDFTRALKIAQKAQRLFPDLENISQLLAVCEVQCSAQVQISTTDKDWYKILQIEQTVDAVTIKKQYRKLSLLIHPDKNKFAGAEAAFKMISEANMVLSDQAKRSNYDMKYPNQGPPEAPFWLNNGNLSVKRPSNTVPGPQPMSKAGPAAKPNPQPMSKAGPAAKPNPQPMSKAGPAAKPNPQPMSKEGPAAKPNPQPMSKAGPAARPNPQPMSKAGPAAKPNGESRKRGRVEVWCAIQIHLN